MCGNLHRFRQEPDLLERFAGVARGLASMAPEEPYGTKLLFAVFSPRQTHVLFDDRIRGYMMPKVLACFR